MEYKKLENKELEVMYQNLRGYFENNPKHSKLVELVKEFYPLVSTILVSIDSEYNDSTYDNKTIGVFVFDSNAIELPLPYTERIEFNRRLNNIQVGISEETNDPLESIVIYVNKKLPEIYIKEK